MSNYTTAEKLVFYNERKKEKSNTWLLFLFTGWSYGGFGDTAKQVLFYLTLGGFGLWTLYVFFTLNRKIRLYNLSQAKKVGLDADVMNMLNLGKEEVVKETQYITPNVLIIVMGLFISSGIIYTIIDDYYKPYSKSVSEYQASSKSAIEYKIQHLTRKRDFFLSKVKLNSSNLQLLESEKGLLDNTNHVTNTEGSELKRTVDEIERIDKKIILLRTEIWSARDSVAFYNRQILEMGIQARQVASVMVEYTVFNGDTTAATYVLRNENSED